MTELPLENVRLPRGVRRDPCLPVMKRVSSGHVHPLRAHCFARSRAAFTPEELDGVQSLPDDATTYVYMMESDQADTKKRHLSSRNIKFEHPLAKGLLAKGFICLQPGDAVFARPAGGRADGTDDVLQVVVLADRHILSNLGNALRTARDHILGERGLRGPVPPVNGVGGTAFERSGYADPVQKGARAYGILTSEQKWRDRIVGPAKAYKVREDDRGTFGPGVRVEALRAAVNAGIAASKYLPLAYQRALKTQAELVNAPRFGSDENYLFSSVQVNLARPVAFNEPGQSLKDLGTFGVPHVDGSDLPEGFTSIQACSDLPNDIDPGQFVIFELGVFINLDGTVIGLFRGVQFHGGCAPRAKRSGVIIPAWAYRVVFVTYPKASVYLALGTYVLGSLRTVKKEPRASGSRRRSRKQVDRGEDADVSDDDVYSNTGKAKDGDVSRRYLCIGPDLLNNPESHEQETWITHPNFARDTGDIMSRSSLLNFYARSLYLLTVFAAQQIPVDVGVRIDPDVFLSAFSYLDESGDRAHVPAWQYAPRVNDPDANQPRRGAAAAWNAFSGHVTQTIPFSLIRRDAREKATLNGQPAARCFSIHDVQQSEELDGAARPNGRCFQLVKRFDADVVKAPGHATAANGNKRNSKRKAVGSGSSEESDESDSERSDSEEGDSDSTPRPRTLRRSTRLSKSTNKKVPAETDASDEDQPPRKRAKVTQSRTNRSKSTRSAVDRASSSEEDVNAPQASLEYQAWFEKLVREAPSPKNDRSLLEKFMPAHRPPLLPVQYALEDRMICHPWANPLNGPFVEWREGKSPCLDTRGLPGKARSMFSREALDEDFRASFHQSRSALPGSVVALDLLDTSISTAVSVSMSADASKSLTAISNALTGLKLLHARVANDSILTRSDVVSLMAYEAILCACIETLAMTYSQPSISGDGDFISISRQIWHEVKRLPESRQLTFTYGDTEYIFHITAYTRNTTSDFDIQRIVYTSFVRYFCNQVGIISEDDVGVFRLRSWIVWAIVQTLGFDALFHVNVWRVWQFPRTRCAPSRSRGEPSLDLLLPLLGALNDCSATDQFPPSALATLGLAVCTPFDRARVINTARWFSSSESPWVSCNVVVERDTSKGPSTIYRSLAILDRLIGLPCQEASAAHDVSAITTFRMHGKDHSLLPADLALLKFAAENSDYYMPFKAFAPSALRMRELFQDQRPNAMTTTPGFRNVVMTRYLSYNTPFLLSGEQKYARQLTDITSAFTQQPLRDTDYFLNNNFYGANFSRFIDRVPATWNSCEWPAALGRDFMAMWRAVSVGVDSKQTKRYKVMNAGYLLALQICGDYVYAGYLDPPTAMQMGEVIHKINAGGVAGLCDMGFLCKRQPSPGQKKASYQKGEVQDAFVKYYDWISGMMTEEEKTRWKWNVITAENHLCKHHRLHKCVDALVDVRDEE